MTASNTPTLVCRIGFNYEPAKGKPQRFEPGDTVAGLPGRIASDLLGAGVIEAAQADAKDAA